MLTAALHLHGAQGYQTYVTLMYVLAALIYTVAAAVAALTLAMRKQVRTV